MKNRDSRIQYTSTIRKANLEDLSRIIEINTELHLPTLKIPFKWDSKEWIEEEINKGNFYIAENNGEAVGAVTIDKDEYELYVETLAVRKDFQHQGIGTTLLKFVIDEAIKGKIPKVTLESFIKFNLKDYYLGKGFILDNPAEGIYEGEPFYKFVIYLNKKS